MTAPHPADAGFEDPIRRLYPELPAAERRLADVVLARHAALLGYSATELASLAQTSKATAARFFRRLGYADFQAFRAHVRARAGADPAPLHRMAQVQPARALSARLRQHAAHDAAALERLPQALDEAALARAVQLLQRARRVWIAGYRNAHAMAFYAQALLHQVRPQVALLNEIAARDSELLADIDARDALLVIDLRRRTRHLATLAAALRATGAPLVLLTDAQASTLEAGAHAVLRCPTHSAQLFDSYVTPASLVNFLAAELAARASGAARERLARIESLHLALDDLQGEPGPGRKNAK